MHIRLLAVGDRQPAWVNDAYEKYAERLPREWKFRLDAVPTVRRSKNDKSLQAMEAEGAQVLARLQDAELVVLLDERGNSLSSSGLASKLADWQRDGRDLCLVIGGPDGVSEACHRRADFKWSLSPMTLPHGLARVLVTEALYRAWSMNSGHPYHRA